MADVVTNGASLIAAIAGSEAVMILLIVLVFGIIIGYGILLWLSRSGY